MQFAVPQFTEVEDRLIGSLTLKQFFVLLGAGGIILFIWSILGPSLPFFILAVPIGLAGLAVALGKYNGRPMFIYLLPFFSYTASTKVMVFKREGDVTTVSQSDPTSTSQKTAEANTEELEPTESRLKKLAYLMDQKTNEEGELISRNIAQRVMAPPVTAARKPVSVPPKKTENKVVQRVLEQAKAIAKKIDVEELSAKAVKSKPVAPTQAIQSKAPQERPQTKAKKFDPSSFLQI